MRSYVGLLAIGLVMAAAGCNVKQDDKPKGSGGQGGGSSTGGGSVGGAGGAGGGADPCMGVPVEGQCVGTDKIQSCFVSEDSNAAPQIIEVTCDPGQSCVVVAGSAKCKPPGDCFEGDTRCKDTSTLQTCVGGAWQDSTCGGTDSCIAQPGQGATCTLQDTNTGITLRGHLDYEFHKPNAALTDFDPAVLQEPAVDFFVTVYDNNNLIGMGLTSPGGGADGLAAGDWLIDLSTTPTDQTFVYYWPMLFDSQGNPRLAVAKAQSTEAGFQSSTEYWSWGFTVGAGATDVGAQLIDEASGSGAAHIYQWLDYGTFRMEGLVPNGAPLTVAVYWAPDNDFDCGNCFAPPQMGGGNVTYDAANNLVDHYDSSMNFSGSSDTPSHWGRTTINHEFGHWIMQSYSKSPGEGGTHFVDQVSKPGLAYSEGWASFNAQATISNSPDDPDPIEFRKSHGTSFWVDLSNAKWSGGVLQTCDPSGPLDQGVNENIVSAMMWSLWANTKAQVPQGLGDGPLYTVLPSQRLVGDSNRGYFKIDMIDYMDALKCEQLATAAQLSAVAEPDGYPYDNQEICP